MKYEVGQFIKHVHADDARWWIEAIVMREAPEEGEGFYQVFVLDRVGYTVVTPGLPAFTRLSGHMDWKVLA